MAPDHCEVVGHDPADVEWGPIAAGDVLLIELPQPGPLLAALVGMAVQVEEDTLRCAAPEVRQLLPVEPGIDFEIFVQALEQAPAVARGAANQLVLVHRSAPSPARCNREPSISDPRRSAHSGYAVCIRERQTADR